jgi:hypothetical protein
MWAGLPFTGVVEGTSETLSGRVVIYDEPPFEGDVAMFTNQGVKCSGALRRVVGVHQQAKLSCADGREAELNLRFYGQNLVSYGALGGKRVIFSFPTFQRHRSW